MNAALAARLPAEMLDRVGQVEIGRRDGRFAKQSPQQLARGSDERLALPILVIAGHLADQHEARFPGAFAGNALRRALP